MSVPEIGEILKKFRCKNDHCHKTVTVRAANVDGHSGHIYLVHTPNLGKAEIEGLK